MVCIPQQTVVFVEIINVASTRFGEGYRPSELGRRLLGLDDWHVEENNVIENSCAVSVSSSEQKQVEVEDDSSADDHCH